jgi:hypothetical protein
MALSASTALATFPGADGRILFQRYAPQYGVFTVAPDGGFNPALALPKDGTDRWT